MASTKLTFGLDESSPYKRRIMLLRDFKVGLINQTRSKHDQKCGLDESNPYAREKCGFDK